MFRLSSRTIGLLLFATVMVSAQTVLSAGERYDPQEAYKAYFEERYGTYAKPADPRLIEQRAREDIVHHFMLLHTGQAAGWNYYTDVAQLWSEHATQDSLADLERLIEVGWLLRYNRLRLDRDTAGLDKDKKYDCDYMEICGVLSSAWLRLKLEKLDDPQKGELLVNILLGLGEHHPPIEWVQSYLDGGYNALIRSHLQKMLLNEGENVPQLLVFAIMAGTTNPQGVGAAGQRYDHKKVYQAYFEERYGSQEKPLDPRVIEQNARQEMIRHFALLHMGQLSDGRHYINVAKLWRENATQDSLQDIERLIEVAWLIRTNQAEGFEQAARGQPLYTPALYGQTWNELSEAWLQLKLQTLDDNSKAALLVSLLKRSGKYHPHMEAVGPYLVKYGVLIRKRFYDTILHENEDLREDIMGVALPIGSETLKATDAEIDAMLQHPNVEVRDTAVMYLVYGLYNDPRGHKLALTDLASEDWRKQSRAVSIIRDYLNRPIPNSKKDELFNAVDTKMRDIEAGNDSYLPISPVTQKPDSFGLIGTWTGFLSRSEYVTKNKLEVMERHVSWLQEQKQKLGVDCVFDIDNYRRVIDESKRK